MRKMRANVRLAAVALATALLLSSASCGTQSPPIQPTLVEQMKPVNLIYYTIGAPDRELYAVNQEINKVLKEEINVTIDYRKVGWQEYESRLKALVAANSEFDVAFALKYADYAQKGAWLCLDNYLLTIGKEMYDVIDPTLWKGVRMMDGKIYGVPTNKELAVQQQWMYPKELVDKYRIDVSAYNTLESLEPLLEIVSQQEPDWQPMELDRDSGNFFALEGYEYLTDNNLPLMVKSSDKKPQVVNIFDTEDAERILHVLRKYYQLGYINEDAALKQIQALAKGEKVFWKMAGGGPFSDVLWSKDRGYPLVAHPVTTAVATTESAQGGVMAVSANSKHPEESVRFLNLLNTDAELRNLFNFGVEGVQYERDATGRVDLMQDNGYSGVQYTQGNWFLLYPLDGLAPDPLDKWQQYQAFNAKVTDSTMLGFTPDLANYTRAVSNIRGVCDKYYSSLMTGSVDVDTELPKFRAELNQCGIGEVRYALQNQLDTWLSQFPVEAAS